MLTVYTSSIQGPEGTEAGVSPLRMLSVDGIYISEGSCWRETTEEEKLDDVQLSRDQERPKGSFDLTVTHRRPRRRAV